MASADGLRPSRRGDVSVPENPERARRLTADQLGPRPRREGHGVLVRDGCADHVGGRSPSSIRRGCRRPRGPAQCRNGAGSDGPRRSDGDADERIVGSWSDRSGGSAQRPAICAGLTRARSASGPVAAKGSAITYRLSRLIAARARPPTTAMSTEPDRGLPCRARRASGSMRRRQSNRRAG